MPRGSRPGERRGGRKKGTPNKKTAELQARVAAEGITPLEVMVGAMRALWAKNEAVAAAAIAKDAAPYLHPRLASVEYSGPYPGPIQVEEWADADRIRALGLLLAKAIRGKE